MVCTTNCPEIKIIFCQQQNLLGKHCLLSEQKITFRVNSMSIKLTLSRIQKWQINQKQIKNVHV